LSIKKCPPRRYFGAAGGIFGVEEQRPSFMPLIIIVLEYTKRKIAKLFLDSLS
jgi:hypothetical protein